MKVVALVVSGVLFLGGMALMGYAPEVANWEGLTFFGGIIAMALSFALPMYVLPKFD
ncbi:MULTISPECIES: hypothetical protein [Humibacter]|jgi:hypothetical protein